MVTPEQPPPGGDGAGAGAGAAAGTFDPEGLLGRRPDVGPVRFGMAAPTERRDAIEAAAGQRLGIVRVFARWDTPFPTEEQAALLAEGRTLHLSIRPRTEAGKRIGWAELAAAPPTSEVGLALDRWVRAVAVYGSQVYLTFNHEPETRASDGHGTPGDFQAAWRRLVERLRANGGQSVRTVLVLTRGAYDDGRIDDWYPGDDTVDVIGVDAYNWSDCQGGPPRPWIMPDALLAPAVEFAEARAKPLAVPEIASTENHADPLAKARWILALAQTLASPPVVDRLEFAAWFDPDDAGWPNCAWRHDSSTPSRLAMAAAVAWLNDPG